MIVLRGVRGIDLGPDFAEAIAERLRLIRSLADVDRHGCDSLKCRNRSFG